MINNKYSALACAEGLATSYLHKIGFPINDNPEITKAVHTAFAVGYCQGHLAEIEETKKLLDELIKSNSVGLHGDSQGKDT